MRARLHPDRHDCLMHNPWNEYVLPRMTDQLLDNRTVAGYRERAAAKLTGEVVEIGFGSGLNVPAYPKGVTKVIAIEPSTTARNLARERVGATTIPIEFRGLDGQHLPLSDASADSALSTFTLCTIPDAGKALSELHRVLKPGGTFCFVEHGVSPNPRVSAWQNRLNPVQQRVAGGCNLNRRIDELVTNSGFEIQSLDTFEMPGPRLTAPWGYVYLGCATRR